MEDMRTDTLFLCSSLVLVNVFPFITLILEIIKANTIKQKPKPYFIHACIFQRSFWACIHKLWLNSNRIKKMFISFCSDVKLQHE
ncbi:unnamed protein product [Sphenostylis stenocarpa]|uniref:Uncharacterized protein n=1 Tax=Sphenostylis stenocarpa TaxID=92480 RepID=A0AA86T505_9FABA|nr:unnamed protein product [Sphenostylis stenocarpa]